jgi:hypothetical protein
MRPLPAIIILLIALSSCNPGQNSTKNVTDSPNTSKGAADDRAVQTDSPAKDSILTLNLQYGFKIKAGQAEDLGKFKTYSYIELWHNNVKLFTDAKKEYEFADKLYPVINSLKPDVFELLIEYNDRPLPDKLAFFRIENDKIIKKDILPAFDGKPEEINGTLEYSGRLDDSEVLAKGGKEYLPYNPVLYYKVTAGGIKLDSALTIEKNKEKFGSFRGFRYNDKIYYLTDAKGNIDTAEKDIIRH